MKNRRLLIVAAIALAVIAVGAFVIFGVFNRPVATVPMRDVLVANRSIPPHTPLSESMFEVVQRPADHVDPNALSSLHAVDGMVSSGPIVDGTPIGATDIAPKSALGLAVALRPGMRAISIAVDPVKDVSDLLHPGDHVDVIAAPPRQGTNAAAFTIMRDITVLSVGNTFVSVPAPAPSGGNAQPVEARTVTLEVTPTQADLLTMADLNTTLRLALRPPNERPTSGLVEHVVFFDANPAPVQAPAPVAAPPAPRPVPTPGVLVIDGDKLGGGSH